MKQFNIEDLTLLDITLSSASIENADNKTLPEQDGNIFQYSLAFENLFNLEKEGLLIKLHLDIKSLDEKKEFFGINANFTTQFTFQVLGLSEYIEKYNDKGFKIEQQLAGSLVNIVYSTTRGILYTRCLGTVLDTVILPIIPSMTLLDLFEQPKRKKSKKKSSKE